MSILMTVYNGLPYLPAAVESMLAQTYTDLELVIVDDGSTGGTPSYLASLDDPRLRQWPEIGMVGSFTRILGDTGPDGVVAAAHRAPRDRGCAAGRASGRPGSATPSLPWNASPAGGRCRASARSS